MSLYSTEMGDHLEIIIFSQYLFLLNSLISLTELHKTPNGSVFISYGGLMAKPGTTSAGEIHLTVHGLVIICMYCTLSGLGGVYSEFVLKKKYEVINCSFTLITCATLLIGVTLSFLAFIIYFTF